MDAKDVYQLYHTECIKAKSGKIPRKIVNFDNFEIKDNKIYFEKFAAMADQSGDLLNPELFIRALAVQAKGFFNPKTLNCLSAIKIYRMYLEELNNRKDPDDIYAQLLEDCRFVVNFCAENGIADFVDYLNKDIDFIPAIVKHAYTGRISYFFLACIDSFQAISRQFPSDSVDLIRNFDYKLHRSKIIFIAKCRTISDNLEALINLSITKRRNQNKEG